MLASLLWKEAKPSTFAVIR
jgi:hypothetical protein